MTHVQEGGKLTHSDEILPKITTATISKSKEVVLEHQRRDSEHTHIIGMERVFSECGSSRSREES